MEIEILLAAVILIAMIFLATVDLAFSHLSDVGLRRLASESEDSQNSRTALFLREILEYRPRFRLSLSSTDSSPADLIRGPDDSHREHVSIFRAPDSCTFRTRDRARRDRCVSTDTSTSHHRNNPEKKFLLLLPIVRPLYRFVYAVTAPFTPKLKSREQQKLEATVAPDAPDGTDDNDEDFQALMEVGEAEGIIEEKGT
jgi:hypothetical protein